MPGSAHDLSHASTNPSGVGTLAHEPRDVLRALQERSRGRESRAGGGQREVEPGVMAQELVAALDGLRQEIPAVQPRLGHMRTHALGPHVVGQLRDAREEVLETGERDRTRPARRGTTPASDRRRRSAAASRYDGLASLMSMYEPG